MTNSTIGNKIKMWYSSYLKSPLYRIYVALRTACAIVLITLATAFVIFIGIATRSWFWLAVIAITLVLVFL